MAIVEHASSRTRSDKDVSDLFERFLDNVPLLPPALASERNLYFVYDSLPVKQHPDANMHEHFEPSDQFQKDPQQRFTQLASPFVLKSIDSGEPSQQILLMDKLQPHAQYEVMIMSAASNTLPGIADHDKRTRQAIFCIMSQFPSFAQSKNLYPYIAFNYDPYTFDRASGQTEKRFHGHLIGRTQEEIIAIKENRVHLETVSPLRQRRFVDETSVLGSLLLYDYLSSRQPLRTMKVVQSNSGTDNSNLLFELQQGWDTLNLDEFDTDYLTLHASLLDLYQSVVSSVATGGNGMWQRPRIKDMTDLNQQAQVNEALSQLGWIHPDNIQNIIYMLSRMKPYINGPMMEFLKTPSAQDIAAYVLPTAGPCYSTAMYEDIDKVYLSIRPYVFSDLGGAGIEYLSQTAVKIKRGVGKYTSKEMHQRQRFQRDFVNFISALSVEI